ncbi:hypothetical protein ACWGH2_32020 [Streptomyces sp. NPDC054871]
MSPTIPVSPTSSTARTRTRAAATLVILLVLATGVAVPAAIASDAPQGTAHGTFHAQPVQPVQPRG